MPTERLVQFDTNVDDLDPRLVPHLIDALLAAGALDAWATPILMKKGRPAVTVSALCRRDDAAAVRSALFRESTTIGVRETEVIRHALERRTSSVVVDGHQIAVKLAEDGGEVVNVSVEWDDVARVAGESGRAAADVLAEATAAARLLR